MDHGALADMGQLRVDAQADGDVVSVNKTLETVLGAADQLVVRRGRIAAVLASENAKLQAAIAHCAGSADDRSVARDIPVWGLRGSAPLIVSVCPVRGSAAPAGANRPSRRRRPGTPDRDRGTSAQRPNTRRTPLPTNQHVVRQ